MFNFNINWEALSAFDALSVLIDASQGDTAPTAKTTSTPAPASVASFRAKEQADVAAKPAPTPVVDEQTKQAAKVAQATPAPTPVATSTASAASVRAKEAADAATMPKPNTPVVDERTQLMAKGVISAPKKTATQIREDRMAQLKKEREDRVAAAAAERAASDPTLNYAVRPAAPPSDENYIYYYSWIGGVNTGSWRLYRAPNNDTNQAVYGSRAIGGNTQASANSAVGANSLTVQPQPIKDSKGKITGWTAPAGSTTNNKVVVTGNGNNGNGNNGNGNNGNGNNGNGNNGSGDGSTGGPTTNIDVLKSLLRGMGFTTTLIDSSADFLNRLLKDGLDYDNAISIFLDSKEYTFKDGNKTTSPFYTAYGYLNEGLTTPKSASELFNAVEGYKEVVSKYALSDKYLTSDSLKKYVKNNVSVSELDERANAARLKAVNADKNYTDALIGLGYIKTPTDLTDFFLNPDIGKEVLEQNRSTAAFSAEAIRRTQQGVQFDAERFKKLTASLMGLGLSEEKIAATAAEGFENIGEQLRPTQKLAGIYERMPASDVNQIQQELEAEQFLGTASQRRKRLAEQEVRAFQRSSGTTTSSLKGRTAGII